MKTRTTMFSSWMLSCLLVSVLLLGNVSAQTTVAPTGPTVSQTAGPTNVPTAAATGTPVATPTTSPTTLPPTSAPTGATSPTTLPPTSATPGATSPTPLPPTSATPGAASVSPTNLPSSTPTTRAPTTVPTLMPTQSPIIGTRSPAVQTPSPTVGPTAEATLELQQHQLSGLMQFKSMAGALVAGERIDWEISTEAHIREALRALDLPASISDLSVDTEVIVQTELRKAEGSSGYVLQVEFFVFVDFRSTKTDYDVPSLVRKAFDTQADNNRYIQRLKGQSTAFQNVESVQVSLDGQTITPGLDDTSKDKEEGNDMVLYIIAGAGGGCGLVVLGLCCLYLTRKSRDSESPHSPGRGKGDITACTSASPLGLAADIVVDRRNDDISTLGDPTPIATHQTPDEQTASIGNDYDYSRDYRRAHGIASDHGSLDRNESVGSRTHNSASFFSSDNSVEDMMNDPNSVRRFEVTVPPGKLGMVMDNSPSGTPMVYAVKPNSVLARDVQVGDRLISVDQEDVTIMTAVQVSKLISLKNDQERLLVFCRKLSSDMAQDV